MASAPSGDVNSPSAIPSAKASTMSVNGSATLANSAQLGSATESRPNAAR